MLVRGFRILFLLVVATLQLASCSGSSTGTAPERPNILFVIMDDVGIDQMPSFGYGGATPPNMPNIDAVAQAGLRFGNTWSMPECSPGRAAMFVGRYPLRTNIYQAIGENDLANSQLTPDDMTTPKLLRTAGYESGLFGKFHLAGPENNAAGNGTPGVLGWDYFYGWVGGLPASIDTTARRRRAAGHLPLRLCSAGQSRRRGQRGLLSARQDLSAPGRCVARAGRRRQAVRDPRRHLCATGCMPGLAAGVAGFRQGECVLRFPARHQQCGGVEVVPLTDRRARGLPHQHRGRRRDQLDPAAQSVTPVDGHGQPDGRAHADPAAAQHTDAALKRHWRRAGLHGPGRAARPAEPDDRSHGHRGRALAGRDGSGPTKP
jgi:hypothetical protein